MPIQRITNDGETIRLYVDSDTKPKEVRVSLTRDSLPASRRVNGQENADKMAAALQSQIDVRQQKRDLPDEDPDKAIDPAKPFLFHDGPELVSREVLVAIEWTGSKYVVHLKTARPLRNARDT